MPGLASKHAFYSPALPGALSALTTCIRGAVPPALPTWTPGTPGGVPPLKQADSQQPDFLCTPHPCWPQPTVHGGLSNLPRDWWSALSGHLSGLLSHPVSGNQTFSNKVWTMVLGRAMPHLMSLSIHDSLPQSRIFFRDLFTYLWLFSHYNEYLF